MISNNWAKGKSMISSTFDFEQFADTVKEKDFFDVIYLAEQEAINAWRISNKKKLLNGFDSDLCRSYQSKLKGLIHFMRYGVKPNGLNKQDDQLFNFLYQNTQPKSRN
jgi:hypothetical protein